MKRFSILSFCFAVCVYVCVLEYYLLSFCFAVHMTVPVDFCRAVILSLFICVSAIVALCLRVSVELAVRPMLCPRCGLIERVPSGMYSPLLFPSSCGLGCTVVFCCGICCY